MSFIDVIKERAKSEKKRLFCLRPEIPVLLRLQTQC